MIICDSCGAENLDNMKFCKQCGSKLTVSESVDSEGQIPGGRATAVSNAPVTVENKYTALRGIASLCRLLGWVFVGLAGLGALFGLITIFSDSFFTGLGFIVGAAIWGAVMYIFWNIIAESISVLLDIEMNTRRAAAILEQRAG